jgi:hypothetical protein
MNTEEYLEWFRSNYDLMQRHFDGALLFDVNYDTTGWVAGYGYIEDYDGTYFLKNLRGDSDAVFYALRESYVKTRLIVKKFSTVEKTLVSVNEFQKGESYTVIQLGRPYGGIYVASMTAARPVNENDSRHRFKNEQGSTLLYRPDQCKFIYPAIEQEMADYLNA